MSEPDSPEFDLTVSDGPDGHVVSVRGELDVATTPLLQATIADLASRGRPIALDTSEVAFMDSSGLAGLLALRRDPGWGRLLVLRSPSEAVTRVLDITGLLSAFDIQD